MGPALIQRLRPVFDAVERYEKALGDLYSIFDRESEFLAKATSREQAEVDRLAQFGSSNLYLNADDAKLASLALVRSRNRLEAEHAVEGLAARLILMTDVVGKRRGEYRALGGLARQATYPN